MVSLIDVLIHIQGYLCLKNYLKLASANRECGGELNFSKLSYKDRKFFEKSIDLARYSFSSSRDVFIDLQQNSTSVYTCVDKSLHPAHPENGEYFVRILLWRVSRLVECTEYLIINPKTNPKDRSIVSVVNPRRYQDGKETKLDSYKITHQY